MHSGAFLSIVLVLEHVCQDVFVDWFAESLHKLLAPFCESRASSSWETSCPSHCIWSECFRMIQRNRRIFRQCSPIYRHRNHDSPSFQIRTRKQGEGYQASRCKDSSPLLVRRHKPQSSSSKTLVAWYDDIASSLLYHIA